jgi:hypothetical protein
MIDFWALSIDEWLPGSGFLGKPVLKPPFIPAGKRIALYPHQSCNIRCENQHEFDEHRYLRVE